MWDRWLKRANLPAPEDVERLLLASLLLVVTGWVILRVVLMLLVAH